MPGRIAALLLLAVALWLPGPADQDDAMVAVLIDHSTSMSPMATETAKQRLARELGALDDGLEVNAMRFGDSLPDEPLPDVLRRSALEHAARQRQQHGYCIGRLLVADRRATAATHG